MSDKEIEIVNDHEGCPECHGIGEDCELLPWQNKPTTLNLSGWWAWKDMSNGNIYLSDEPADFYNFKWDAIVDEKHWPKDFPDIIPGADPIQLP